jgi:4-amino-4-deoxy-L-arabinose transferase-like glycosyltransferase
MASDWSAVRSGHDRHVAESGAAVVGRVPVRSPRLSAAAVHCADVPLAFFILAGAVLFELHDAVGGSARLALLAGVFTALAAWTKNEGLLVLAVNAIIRLGLAARHPSWAKGRHLALAALGAIPVVAVLLIFKPRFAPPNDLVAGQSSEATLARLIDPRRYGMIAVHFLRALLSIGPGAVVLLACYRLLLGRAPRRPNGPRGLHVLALLALMLLGYAAVYLTMPNDLSGHLHYSLDRLYVQLWPAALLAFFLAPATPEEASSRRGGVLAEREMGR